MGDLLVPAAVDTAKLDDFYKTISSISFTLLGLWWVVGQVKYRDWALHPRRRRQAYAVSLYFLLPGVMTMLSAVNSDFSALWRIAFGVAAVVGIVEVALYASAAEIRTAGASSLRACAALLYLLIAVFAISPPAAQGLGLGMAPRQVEAILVALVIVVGVNLAWFGLTEPVEDAEPARTSGR